MGPGRAFACGRTDVGDAVGALRNAPQPAEGVDGVDPCTGRRDLGGVPAIDGRCTSVRGRAVGCDCSRPGCSATSGSSSSELCIW